MNNMIRNMMTVVLLLLGSTPALYAQTQYVSFPQYYNISNGTEWSSELLTFKEPVEGFRLTVFETNYSAHKYNGYPFVTLAEVDITDANGNEITYTATTNSLAANDGNGLAGLSDNDLGNNGHYHSAYSGNVAISPNSYVYIDFKFNEPQSEFRYRQVRRNNTYNYPLYFAISKLGKNTGLPFNPTNPPEPDGAKPEEVITYYTVTISASPASVATVSSNGKFTTGSSKYIYSNLKQGKNNYRFSHWTLNGEYYGSKSSFYYYVENFDADFVAHYVFDPSSPTEPERLPEIVCYPLNLATNNEAVCSFNQTSGNEYEPEAWVALEAFVGKGYRFDGWYNGSTLINSNKRFNYQMPEGEVTLTAKVSKIVFDPANPSEPDSSQSNVQTTLTGDINKDGVVDVLDIVAVVNYSLKEADENRHRYDVNGDGTVDVIDIVKVVNLSLE